MESAEPAGGLRRWQFGELVLDERTLELSLRGQPLRMHRKPLQVLLHLLQHADEVVTKDELAEACSTANCDATLAQLFSCVVSASACAE